MCIANEARARVTATVPVGGDPARGGGGSGHPHRLRRRLQRRTVSVIDGSTHTVTATVPVGKEPHGVAVDPGTHTVYVTNLGDARCR